MIDVTLHKMKKKQTLKDYKLWNTLPKDWSLKYKMKNRSRNEMKKERKKVQMFLESS